MNYFCLMKFISLLLSLFICNASFSQDKAYVKNIINQLTSDEMEGRGYVKDGSKKAADFIVKELNNIGVKALNNQFLQEFYVPINKFEFDVEVIVDDTKLRPGFEYIVAPECPAAHGSYKIIKIDSAIVDNPLLFKKLSKKSNRNKMFLVDKAELKNIIHKEQLSWILNNGMNSKGLVYIEDKLTWSASQRVEKYVEIYIKRGIVSTYLKEITFNIESEFVNGYPLNNVIGKIQGSDKPDSFIVFTAHYDHLGKMGREAIFPGANDNAGGVAMLLDLAKYYILNKPKCSVIFIFFAGEELGLTGSNYFVEKPTFNLNNIKFLINLDLVTTGEKGMTVVNATSHAKQFDTLVYINKVMEYLPIINPRSNAANSDHYPFTLKKIPAFFFYLLGEYPYYHDVNDTYDKIKLLKYEEAFRLIKQFSNTLM